MTQPDNHDVLGVAISSSMLNVYAINILRSYLVSFKNFYKQKVFWLHVMYQSSLLLISKRFH